MSYSKLYSILNSRCNIFEHTWNCRWAFGCRRRAILSSRCAGNCYTWKEQNHVNICYISDYAYCSIPGVHQTDLHSQVMTLIPVKDRYPLRIWTVGRTDASSGFRTWYHVVSESFHWPVRSYRRGILADNHIIYCKFYFLNRFLKLNFYSSNSFMQLCHFLHKRIKL